MISCLTELLAAAPATGSRPRMLLLDGFQAGANVVVVVGERGTVLRSTDSGLQWRAATPPTRACLTGIALAPPESGAPALRGWAVGHDATILATTDGGLTWSRQYQGENLEASFLDVLAVDEQRVLAVGADGLFVASNDGGATWSKRKINEDGPHLNRITRGPTGTIYLAGERGTLLRSEDRGEKWTSIATPYTGSFFGVLPLDRRTLLAYGLGGRIYRTADDGAAWEQIATPAPFLLATAIKLKSNTIVVAGNAASLLVSRDYGKTFTPTVAPAKAIAKLVELPDGNLLALGESGAHVIPSPR